MFPSQDQFTHVPTSQRSPFFNGGEDISTSNHPGGSSSSGSNLFPALSTPVPEALDDDDPTLFVAPPAADENLFCFVGEGEERDKPNQLCSPFSTPFSPGSAIPELPDPGGGQPDPQVSQETVVEVKKESQESQETNATQSRTVDAPLLQPAQMQHVSTLPIVNQPLIVAQPQPVAFVVPAGCAVLPAQPQLVAVPLQPQPVILAPVQVASTAPPVLPCATKKNRPFLPHAIQPKPEPAEVDEQLISQMDAIDKATDGVNIDEIRNLVSEIA